MREREGSGTEANRELGDKREKEKGGTKVDDNREIDLTFQLNPFNDRARRRKRRRPVPERANDRVRWIVWSRGTRDEFVGVAI